MLSEQKIKDIVAEFPILFEPNSTLITKEYKVRRKVKCLSQH